MPTQANYERMKIYIPIWLDLLFVGSVEDIEAREEFTFQYG